MRAAVLGILHQRQLIQNVPIFPESRTFAPLYACVSPEEDEVRGYRNQKRRQFKASTV